MRFDPKLAAEITKDADLAFAKFTQTPGDPRHVEELFLLIRRITNHLAQMESDSGSAYRT